VPDFSEIVEILPPLREVIRAHNLRAEKSLGQNFLLDMNITDKIIRHAFAHYKDLERLNVFEVGPGPGGLTRSILKARIKHLTAIEFDPRAVGALQDLVGAMDGRLDVLQQDALSTDMKILADAPRAIIANLPYNIATPLTIGWLKQIHTDPQSYDVMALMYQKEVAQRITAKVGDKAYGRLSVLAGWLCETKILFDLPGSAFVPPPKVKSSIVRFTPKARSDKAQFTVLENITAAAFGQRRKMVRSSLADYAQYFEVCDIDPQARAENLSVAQYVALSEAVA